ncbi:MAG: divergent PAP2 family protein [Peptococcaceae bacterium]|nr:divergent PAP2 family protein [Peptococcaceae bacterium]
MTHISAILDNMIMWASLTAFLVAQVAKIIFNFFVEKKWDLNLLMSSGSFPSSHTAIVCALAVSVGKVEGWDSSLFAISVALAVIVMYDAAGVRRAAGNQAKVINYVVDWLKMHQGDRLVFNLEEKRLKELIGHTPFEVFGGAIVGCLVAIIFFGI